MRLALVHDWLNQIGGAENVLERLVSLYPESPVFTAIYDAARMPPAWRGWNIRTGWMDHLPLIHRYHQPYLLLYPLFWAAFSPGDFDLILSNKSGFCHGLDKGDAVHVCYCLAPTRYVWQFEHYVAREGFSRLVVTLLRPLLAPLRKWDFDAAQRVDHFIAISTEIQERIRAYYQRDSVVIYPPVDTARFQPTDAHEDYYLVVSRLIPYKRVDLAVQACTALGLPLKVAGDGRDRARLEALAGPSVEFLGRVPDAALPDLMARCKAFLFPGLEDFGIAPVEAQAAGRPVIAFRGGGALDTVIEGKTGLFFDTQEPASLVEALRRLDSLAIDPADCRANAERFSAERFDREIRAFIDAAGRGQAGRAAVR